MAPGEEAPRTLRGRDVLDLLGVQMSGPTDDPQQTTELVSGKLWELTRLLMLPVLVAGALVSDELRAPFWILLALRAVWTTAGLTDIGTPRLSRYPSTAGSLAEVLLAAGMVLTTGASQSPLRVAIFGAPLVGGYLVSPSAVVRIALGCASAYVIGALPDLWSDAPGTAKRFVLFGVGMLLATSCGLVFSFGRQALTRRAANLDAARRRLLNDGLDAEDLERRRVSGELHGDALQLLLAASQDLGEGGAEGLGRAQAGVREGSALLRETVRDLHPAAVRHVGLEAAVIAALAHRVADVLSVRVEPGAEEVREAFLLSVVRELGDALSRAGADQAVAARVSRGPRAIHLAVTAGTADDDPARLRAALARTAARVEADGGSLRCGTGIDGRSAITVCICVEPAAAEEPRDAPEVRRRSLIGFSGVWLVLLLFATLLTSLQREPSTTYTTTLMLIACYHAIAIAVTWRGPGLPAGGRLGAALSMLAFVFAIDAQGGVGTAAAALTIALPFFLVLAFEPRDALRLNLLLLLGIAALIADNGFDGKQEWIERSGILAATALWAFASSMLVTAGRQRMRQRLAGLEHARRALLHDSLAAADAERRRLSERLHDGALQELMAAGQDLDQALGGDAEAAQFAGVELASAILQLRDIVADLHPPALEHGGLRPALAAVVQRAGHRAGFAVDTEVEDGVDGVRDEFLLALVRELVANASKHAAASRLSVSVGRDGEMLVLDVVDDGVGTTPERLAAALAAGHIGLAAARERVEADGGALEVDTGPGRGTHVRVRVPADPAAALR